MNKTYDMVYIGMFAILIAICSWITIPTIVPFTLQTLGVFTALGVLGGRRGTLAILIYILLGTIGIPVFSGFRGGIGVLLGNTGGYIAGFLVSALLMWGMEKLFGKGRIVRVLSMGMGLLVCYMVGTFWFMFVYVRTTGPIGMGTVLSWCVLPFVIPDGIKIVLSLVLTERLEKVIKA